MGTRADFYVGRGGPGAPNTFGLSDPAQVEAAGDGD